MLAFSHTCRLPSRVAISQVLLIPLVMSAASCATVTPTRPSISAFERGFDCEALRGTEQGLLLQIRFPDGFLLSNWVGIYRDGQLLTRFTMGDVGLTSESITIGDEEIVPGETYQYACGLFEDNELLARADVTVVARAVPDRPPSPSVSFQVSPHEQGAIVSWSLPEGTWAQVLRRDILAGDEPTPISPILGEQHWLDRSAVPGQVYAYSIRAVIYEGTLPWRSEPGTERYIEVAIQAN